MKSEYAHHEIVHSIAELQEILARIQENQQKYPKRCKHLQAAELMRKEISSCKAFIGANKQSYVWCVEDDRDWTIPIDITKTVEYKLINMIDVCHHENQDSDIKGFNAAQPEPAELRHERRLEELESVWKKFHSELETLWGRIHGHEQAIQDLGKGVDYWRHVAQSHANYPEFVKAQHEHTSKNDKGVEECWTKTARE